MNLDTATDTQLLKLIGDRDQNAMKAFYQRHSASVFRFANRTLQSEVDASEVMNEVMLQVWKKPDAFEGRAKVTTWLFSITHNKAVDAVRRNAKFGAELSGEAEEYESADSNHCDLFAMSDDDENKGFVQHCLNKLKNAQRQVIYLTFFEGLSYPEISEVLELPVGTVKTRVMHAKTFLQKCLSAFLT